MDDIVGTFWDSKILYLKIIYSIKIVALGKLSVLLELEYETIERHRSSID